MSYEIEYSKHAFYVPDPTFEKSFFTYVKTSSNNVDPRTPNPILFKSGHAYEIIGEACRVGASVESGCWKPRNRWTSPEAYIKSWRQKLKEARPFEEFVHDNPSAQIEVAVKKDAFQTYLDTPPANPNPDGYRKDRIKDLITGIQTYEEHFFNDTLTKFMFSLRTYKDVEKAVELTGLLKEEGLLFWQAMRNC